MTVWVVIGLLVAAAVVVTFAARRHTHDVEPAVREFAEFRDAISHQVLGLQRDTHVARTHLDLHIGGNVGGNLGGSNVSSVGERGGERPLRS